MKISLENVSLDVQPEELAQLWALLKGGNIALPPQQFHALPPLDLPPPPPAVFESPAPSIPTTQAVDFQEVEREEMTFESFPPPPPITPVPIPQPVATTSFFSPKEYLPPLSLEYETTHPVGEAIARTWVVAWNFLGQLSENKVVYAVVVSLLLLAIASRVIKTGENVEPTATPSPALVEPAATPTASPIPTTDPEDTIPVPAAPIPEGAM